MTTMMKVLVVLGWIEVFDEKIQNHIKEVLEVSDEKYESLPQYCKDNIDKMRMRVEMVNTIHELMPFPSDDRWDYRDWIEAAKYEHKIISAVEMHDLIQFGIDSLGF